MQKTQEVKLEEQYDRQTKGQVIEPCANSTLLVVVVAVAVAGGSDK